MNQELYDARRIQQKGWKGYESSEKRRDEEESGEGKRSKGRKEKPCDHCGKQYATRKNKRFCSHLCRYAYEVNRWLSCSKCHALIGMTPKQSGSMVGIVAGSVRTQWNKYSIVSQKPHIQGWALVRRKIETQATKEQKQAEIMPQMIYERSWMNEVGSHDRFPDWSYLWTKERANRKEKQTYYSARSQYNRACYADVILHHNKSVFPDWSILWYKSRMSYTPERRARANMRTRLKQIMKLTRKGGSFSKSSLLGCSTKAFAKHLESKFTKRMTWDNYGSYWHVDHIIPCASFDHSNINQVKQCWHWTNLQPLEASRNIEKSDMIIQPQMQLLLCAAM